MGGFFFTSSQCVFPYSCLFTTRYIVHDVSYVLRYTVCVCVLCVCCGGKKREKKGKNGERERKEREVLFLLSWEERDDLPHDLNSQFN